MKKETIKKLVKIFKSYPQIKLVYLFGSTISGRKGPLGDFDFAFYVDEKDRRRRFDIKLNLMTQISSYLKTDKIDVVILNDCDMPELKYNIISEGELIYQYEPFKVVVEPKILNEYFDFRSCLLKYGLTK